MLGGLEGMGLGSPGPRSTPHRPKRLQSLFGSGITGVGAAHKLLLQRSHIPWNGSGLNTPGSRGFCGLPSSVRAMFSALAAPTLRGGASPANLTKFLGSARAFACRLRRLAAILHQPHSTHGPTRRRPARRRGADGNARLRRRSGFVVAKARGACAPQEV